MLIALHKGRGVISRLIGWQTRSDYTHASLIFDTVFVGTYEFIEAEPRGVVTRQGRFAWTANVEVFRVEGLTSEQESAARAFARGQIGKGYDYTMVARFVSRRQEARKASGKWFCSELVFAALQKAGVDLLARCEPWEVSPGLLSKSPLLRPV